FLVGGHAHGIGAGDWFDLGDHLVHRAGAGAGFSDAFALVGGVGLGVRDHLVLGHDALVLLGHPFGAAHLLGAGTTRGRRATTVAGWGGRSRRQGEQAGHERRAETNHAFSFVRERAADAKLARERPAPSTGYEWLQRQPTMPKAGKLVKRD